MQSVEQKIKRSGKSSRGFTLLEVLVSLSILAIISVAAITALTQFLNSRERIDNNQSKIEELNRLFLFLERDISYAVQRPVSGGVNNLFAAMEVYLNNPKNEGEILQFTTAYPIPGTTAQRTERVSWRLLDNALYRFTWQYMDHQDVNLQENDTDNKAIVKQKMLSEVSSVDVNVYMGAGNGSSQRFLNESVIESESDIEALYNLPRLLELSISRNDETTFRRLFYIKSKSYKLNNG